MPKVSAAYLAARRRQILDAAAACFARDGFHRTSMQDIVRESGISAGLVYRYFAGKDDVIAAIVGEWHDQRQIFATGGVDERVAAYLDYLRSVGDPESAARLRLGVQIWAEAVRNPRIRELSRRNVDDPRAAVAAVLRTLPLAPGLDPDALARVLIAVYQGLLVQTVWDDGVDNAAYVGTVEALLGALIRSGPPSAPR
ncbi:TetR/AcrR family transcriptional regulator [Paractinoplanes durhamensis]|uniref:TetR family transcriptional regulator n=1 Tax=Paractinoplanes durhamensis TaxID=113563 RepID=A0ABQ3YQG4_9ACTN|nr:TetR/AcrR family transcriptional regulator [Actinoplanes durhamensis]GID99827.1 TetR family transcriptional regulator [Actinoplanes durhamensis]